MQRSVVDYSNAFLTITPTSLTTPLGFSGLALFPFAFFGPRHFLQINKKNQDGTRMVSIRREPYLYIKVKRPLPPSPSTLPVPPSEWLHFQNRNQLTLSTGSGEEGCDTVSHSSPHITSGGSSTTETSGADLHSSPDEKQTVDSVR